jgi:hypothetical protein
VLPTPRRAQMDTELGGFGCVAVIAARRPACARILPLNIAASILLERVGAPAELVTKFSSRPGANLKVHAMPHQATKCIVQACVKPRVVLNLVYHGR